MTTLQVFFLTIAGACGTLSRYLLLNFCAKFGLSPLFNGIIIVNILGTFLFALVYGLCLKYALPAPYRTIFLTGFMGAFTTFSTLIFEARHLYLETPLLALFYVLIQVIIGFFLLHIVLNLFDL